MIVVAEAMRGIGGTFISGALDAWIADEIGPDAAAARLPALRAGSPARRAGRHGCRHRAGDDRLGLPIAIGGALILALAVSWCGDARARLHASRPRRPGGSWHAMPGRRAPAPV